MLFFLFCPSPPTLLTLTFLFMVESFIFYCSNAKSESSVLCTAQNCSSQKCGAPFKIHYNKGLLDYHEFGLAGCRARL